MVLPQPFEFWVWHRLGLRRAPFELKLLMKSLNSGSQDWHTQTYLEQDFNWSHLFLIFLCIIYRMPEPPPFFLIQGLWASDAILSCLKRAVCESPKDCCVVHVYMWGACIHLPCSDPVHMLTQIMCYLQLVACWPSMHETLSSSAPYKWNL